MGRSCLRYFLVPMLLWWCPTLTGIALLNAAGIATYPAAGYCLAAPTVMLTWWGISLSRWMYRKRGWKRAPYLLTNFLVSLCVWGLGLAFALALARNNSEEMTPSETIGAYLFFAGVVIGTVWLVHSLSKLSAAPKGIHWRLITADQPPPSPVIASPASQALRPPRIAKQPSVSNQRSGNAVKPPSRPKTLDAIFRPVQFEDGSPEPARGVPVPPRGSQPQAPRKALPVAPAQLSSNGIAASRSQVNLSFSGRRSDFFEQAKRFVNRIGQPAEHVPFMTYWPTYESMTSAQQNWYFYWRSEVRRGNYLPTDLSYIFVHVYETLNLVGFSAPRAAFSHLGRLWKHYRVLQPKLDNYLVDWMADFIVVHQLPATALQWYGIALREGAFSGDMDLSIEAWLAAGGDFHQLPTTLLYKWLGYVPTRSKFFAAYGEEYQLENAYQDGLQAVEDSLRAAQDSLFKRYRPAVARTIQRAPFASALHNLTVSSIIIGQVRPWTGREDLVAALTGIIKSVENLKRTQAGYSSKLRGIDLPPEWIAVLDQAFAPAETRRAVVIDMDRVAKLRQESEEIRARLLGEEAANAEAPTAPAPPMTPTPAAMEPAYTQRPADAPAGLLTDLPQVSRVMGKAGSPSAEILRFLADHGWGAPAADIPAALLDGGFLSVALDGINERARQDLGDELVVEEGGQVFVTEDYRDEVAYILQHPDYALQSAPAEVFSALSDEWAQFAHLMTPPQWEALAALLHGEDVPARLEAIARGAFTTVNLLIDEINNAAQDCIGDIVIDTEQGAPFIEEEDIEGLQALVAWVIQQALVEG